MIDLPPDNQPDLKGSRPNNAQANCENAYA